MFAKHLLALWVAVAILAGTTGYAVWAGRNNRSQQSEGIHTFICFFEAAVLKTPQAPAKRAYAIRFFDGVNGALHQPNCPH